MSGGTISVLVVLLGVTAFFAAVALRAFVKYRGVRVVTCPETHKPAAVRVDAGHAAVSAAWDHTELRLDQCSRWPERQNCGQECIAEIAAAPRDCLVRAVLARWYAGKTCAMCEKPIAVLEVGHQPALRAPDGHTFDFAAMPPERLIATLDDYAPVCFDCHIAEQFRRAYPDKVLDRPDYRRPA